MEISQFTDYSLRVLIRAALCEAGERTSAREIADGFGISHNHIVKVVHNLAKLGYLETSRGRGGGITLARPATEIGVGEIVRKTENLALVECLGSKGGCCVISPVCDLKRVFAEARNAFLAVLERYTLDDLVRSKSALRSLLNPATIGASN
jgi:Rrf2 family nitric oxide-sensitive transcriptional repressor